MQVHAAVCDNEYNVGTLSVFSVRNRRRATITLDLGDSGVQIVILNGYENIDRNMFFHSRSTVDLNVACCHVMRT